MLPFFWIKALRISFEKDSSIIKCRYAIQSANRIRLKMKCKYFPIGYGEHKPAAEGFRLQ